MVLIGYVEYFHDMLVGYGFIGIERYEHLCRVGGGLSNHVGQFVECDRLCISITHSNIEIQVFVDGDIRLGLYHRLLFALRQQHLDGIGGNHRAGNHEEDEQQEDDVRHG